LGMLDIKVNAEEIYRVPIKSWWDLSIKIPRHMSVIMMT